MQETDTIFGHGGHGPENTNTEQRASAVTIHVSTGRRRRARLVTGVTEQQAGVSTGGFELLLTDGAAGMRNQPGVSGRILQLPTVTHVPAHTHTHFSVCVSFTAMTRGCVAP